MTQVARVIGCTLLLTAFPLCAAAEDFAEAIHAYLKHCVEGKQSNAGIVVGIVGEHGSRIVSCGELDNGTHQEANGDTLFEIGSVTKTFTTLLLADMIQRGQMELDDPVAKYLPQSVKMPTRNGKEITLQHLATHTSGLPCEPDNVDSEREYNPWADYTADDLYAFLSGYKLTRDPGVQFEYSNPGIALLAQAIALKAGKSYESLVVERICRPLKMDSTRITLTPDLKTRLAGGHGATGYKLPSSEFGALAPDGELRSTANDMLKYLSANLGLTQSSLTPLMQNAHEAYFHNAMPGTDMGLAWATSQDPQGTRIVAHIGATYGYLAYAGFDVARRRGVVVLCNSRELNDLLGLGSVLLKSEWQTDRRPIDTTLSSAVYRSYVGQYQRSPESAPRLLVLRQLLLTIPKAAIHIPAGVCLAVLAVFLWRARGLRTRGIILGGAVLVGGVSAAFLVLGSSSATGVPSQGVIGIRCEGDRLFAQATGARSWPVDAFLPPRSAELLPESETSLFERLSGTRLTFARDSKGKVTGLTADYHGDRFSFEKTSDEPPEASEFPKRPVAITLDRKVLDAFVGRYEFGPNAMFPKGIDVTIRREGERLVLHERGENAVPGAISIYPESETKFFTKIDHAQLTFIKNKQGEVTAAIFDALGLPEYEGKKVGNLSE